MNLKLRHLRLERPLCVFDLETTGTDVPTCRVVEVAVLRLEPSARPSWFHTLVNPECPIPGAASAVHQIYDEHIAHSPSFRAVARDVHRALKGADIAGYNLPFDLGVLAHEFARARHPFRLAGRALFDALAIYRAKEPHTLAAAVRQFLRREHGRTHSAKADVRATIEVLDAQLGHYGDLPDTPAGLHAALVEVDLARKFRRDGEGRVVFAFGKHAGEPVEAVAAADPSYLRWLLDSGGLLEDARLVVQRALAGG
jgi:DNA polymerase-3 subunit epsilon